MPTEQPKGQPVPDGVYDVFIVDATPRPDDETRVSRLDIAIVAGEHKGAAFGLNVSDILGSDIDLMGMPATLTVRNGVPVVTLDP